VKWLLCIPFVSQQVYFATKEETLWWWVDWCGKRT